MVSRRTAIRYYVLGCVWLIALALPAHGQQLRDGEFIELRRDSARTTFFHATTVNVDTLDLFAQARRIIDSLINASAGGSIREERKYDAQGNFSNGANDSINVQVDGNYHIVPFAYNVYADRVMIETNKPGQLGSSSFRDDLPRVSANDTLLIMRLSRNASFPAGQRIGITLYRVARGTGLSFSNTTGVFYDMLRFDESEFNAAGVGTQFRILLLLKKNR